jgi:hypothetical protein
MVTTNALKYIKISSYTLRTPTCVYELVLIYEYMLVNLFHTN